MSAENTNAGGVTLTDLHAANIARQAEWCPDQLPDLSFRGNELAGETGEACNVIKKLERERQGWRGSRATKDQLAEELADVVICADLCAVTAGIDLDAAVRDKFNATSEKVGLTTKIAALSAHSTGSAGVAAEPVATGQEPYGYAFLSLWSNKQSFSFTRPTDETVAANIRPLYEHPPVAAEPVVEWHAMTERPRSCSKVVALYDDGSGAVMLYVHDDGAINCEGFDFEWPDNRFDRWAYLPADVEFHCETGEEPFSLPAPTPPAGGGETISPKVETCPKCQAKGVAFICSEVGCPVNGGAAYPWTPEPSPASPAGDLISLSAGAPAGPWSEPSKPYDSFPWMHAYAADNKHLMHADRSDEERTAANALAIRLVNLYRSGRLVEAAPAAPRKGPTEEEIAALFSKHGWFRESVRLEMARAVLGLFTPNQNRGEPDQGGANTEAGR